jgi:CheY-like chemotaxis protein
MTLLINASYGLALGVGLFFIGVPNAVLWGVLGMLLRYLPYVGPWSAAMLPITLSLAVFRGWTEPLLTIGLFVILEILVNSFLEPWLYSNSIGASAVGIIVAAVAWTILWGPVGLFLAVPLTVCLVVAGNYVPQLRILTILLGDRSTLSIQEQIYQRLLALDEEEPRRITAKYLKESPLNQFFDKVMIPVLFMAEQDRQARVLSEEERDFLLQAAKDLVDDAEGLAPPHEASPAPAGSAPLRILCAPVNDEADAVVADMLERLLQAQGHEVQVASLDLLPSELVQRVEDKGFDAVILSALPPLANRNGRYLCRMLRDRYAELPIIIGLWSQNGFEQITQGLLSYGATRVVTQLSELMAEVQSLAIDQTYKRTAQATAAEVAT